MTSINCHLVICIYLKDVCLDMPVGACLPFFALILLTFIFVYMCAPACLYVPPTHAVLT